MVFFMVSGPRTVNMSSGSLGSLLLITFGSVKSQPRYIWIWLTALTAAVLYVIVP